MKSFEELDGNKDGKVSLEEFLKVAEPPYSARRAGRAKPRGTRATAQRRIPEPRHQRHGFIERAEAEALVHSEFNQYDTTATTR